MTAGASADGRAIAANGAIVAMAACELPGGRLALVTAGEDRTIRLWDAATDSPIGTLSTRPGRVLAVTPYRTADDRPAIAAATDDGGFVRIDVESDLPIGTPVRGHTGGGVRAMAVYRTASGRTAIATTGDDGMIRRWDAETGAEVGAPVRGHTGGIRAIASYRTVTGAPGLVTAGIDGTVRRWDAESGSPIGEPLAGHTGMVRTVTAFEFQDGRRVLASGGADATIRIWDAASGAALATLAGHSDWVTAVMAYDGPGGRPMLASVGTDGVLRRWDPQQAAEVSPPGRHADRLLTLTCYQSPEGVVLAYGGDAGTIHRVEAATGTALGAVNAGHAGRVRAMTLVTADGRPTIITAGSDGTVRRWRAPNATADGTPIVTDGGPVLALNAYTDADGQALATGGGDGLIRLWRLRSGERIGRPLAGHRGRVLGIATYPGDDGAACLASVGDDGRLRRWHPGTGRAAGEPVAAHDTRVRCVTAYTDLSGRACLATGGDDGTVRRWLAATGAPIGEPLAGHVGGVTALAGLTMLDGRPALAAGCGDGRVLRWDLDQGVAAGDPIEAHTGQVIAVAGYVTLDGRPAVVTGGDDRAVRRFDATTGGRIGGPLIGHAERITGVGVLHLGGGTSTVVASVGSDGSMLLWDAVTEQVLRRVFVQPIRLHGLADRRASRDLLGRAALTEELARLLSWHGESDGPDAEPGPSVVSIEGPWGTGKTTIMNLVRERVAAAVPPPGRRRALSTHRALQLLRTDEATTDPPPPAAHRGSVTGWFNPWVHQSSDQVWAGLAHAVTEAVRPVLFPDAASQQRYWLTRNRRRVDRYRLRRQLRWRALSPFFALASLVAVSTALFKLADVGAHTFGRIGGVRVTPGWLAFAIAALLVLAGLADTARRYFGPASAVMPTGLLAGPVLTDADGTPTGVEARRDPLYEARSGYLYLIQHDVVQMLTDLRAAGYDLVLFIDDLDRCGAATTAEVFEAVTLFLSGTTEVHARFVIGIDPAVVAAHLDKVYRDLGSTEAVLHGEDPSPGWAFLRKVVQLPVSVPMVQPPAVDQFVAGVLAVPLASVSPVAPGPAGAPANRTAPARPSSGPPAAAAATRSGAVENQPEVLAIIRERIAEQPERSAREAKRMLNVWQLYQRLLDSTDPVYDDDGVVARACNLVVLAEIVTRWPALQRRLNAPLGDRRVLQILAEAADDDGRWDEALATARLAGDDADRQRLRALDRLRELLRRYDGEAIAALAARVL
ncbi:P-loop NTPase fold protein [Dactylosporangium sucinum]|uniref:KAP NTPase domain-containing protein n=1 Tax=Dactylosporangium sucinum TaxID=1424081 RepID=A0A917U1B7_9ACTN|nr:P-loop NTPase fold protein [Dactylosporangium sucinum]GGM51287.1 hypothetical protein GCM10007977_061320 [Dactylosporangium sucinum]